MGGVKCLSLPRKYTRYLLFLKSRLSLSFIYSILLRKSGDISENSRRGPTIIPPSASFSDFFIVSSKVFYIFALSNHNKQLMVSNTKENEQDF